MTPIPRAIAPLVTITTEFPAACSAAASSQMRASTSSRTAPSSRATIEDPSLTTNRLIGPAVDSRVGIEVERDPGDLDLVPGAEALGLQLAEHPDPLQAPLEVREGLLVVEVIAGEQPLDPLAVDRVDALAGAPHGVAPRRRGPKHAMLGKRRGLPVRRRRPGRRRGPLRHALQERV